MSTMRFDHLPNEIILIITHYLSHNDILHSFFLLNSRFRQLILNHHSCTSLQLPTTNSSTWQRILSLLASHIHSLTIVNHHLIFPLDHFPNLTSLVLSSPHGFSNKQLTRIIESDCFSRLRSLHVEDTVVRKRSYKYEELDSEQILFEKVFNDGNKLEMFEYVNEVESLERRRFAGLTWNVHIRSLKIRLEVLQNVFCFLPYTPNLRSLHIRAPFPSETTLPNNSEEFSEIALEEFLFYTDSTLSPRNATVFDRIHLHVLMHIIQIFSSTLVTLSLRCSYCALVNIAEHEKHLLLNGYELENELLKSMIELKNFHLYVETYKNEYSLPTVISTFRSQFWLDHNWIINGHLVDNAICLYSLPFPFSELPAVQNFDKIIINHYEKLTFGSRLWSNITSLGIYVVNQTNTTRLFRFLKLNLPKVKSLQFFGLRRLESCTESDHLIFAEKLNAIDVTLYHVTTIQFELIQIEHLKAKFFHKFPRFNRLILKATDLPPIDHELTEVFNKQLQRLEVTESVNLATINHQCLPNLEYLQLTLTYARGSQKVEQLCTKIDNFLRNLPKLQCLTLFSLFVGYEPLLTLQLSIADLLQTEIADKFEVQQSSCYQRFVRKTNQI
ncbi:unnamed protein product [Adineta ricciae]|uniref:F-box domain-containing protein n=1 Tax=Adineta ricciae TaxID=249248 RepID=A0A814AI02_ADIRI|nr:unnamed protein product [Adineta ricciae]